MPTDPGQKRTKIFHDKILGKKHRRPLELGTENIVRKLSSAKVVLNTSCNIPTKCGHIHHKHTQTKTHT